MIASAARRTLHEILDVATGGTWTQLIGGDPGPWPHDPVVYGPGRGLYLAADKALAAMEAGQIAPVEIVDAPGVWVITRGPGALGRSAAQRSGEQRPTLHCSSWTNLVLGVLLAEEPSAWHHGGNMPPLEDLVTERGPFAYKVNGGGTIRVLGYGDRCEPVTPRRGRTLTTLELWERREELGPVTLSAQSTKLRSGWKWEHHTVAWIKVPGHDDVLYRCAADGSRRRGGYSGTPMDIEVLDEAKARALVGKQLHRAWTIPVLPEITHCPVTLET